MATVQGIQNNEQGNNWVLPTVGGAVVGAGAGSTLLAGAKYKSFGDLVDAATKDDKFEMPKAPEKAEKEVADNFKVVSDEVSAVKNRLKSVDELFKGDVKEVPVNDVLAKFGKSEVDPKAFDLANIVKGMKEGEAVEVSDAMKNIFKDGEKFDGTALKTALGTMGDVAADGKFTPSKAGIEAAQKTASSANEAVVNFIKGSKEGKVTKEYAEEFARAAQDAKVGSAFESIQKQLGKARLKGALIWGAIGIAAGYIVSKFLGGKKEAA